MLVILFSFFLIVRQKDLSKYKLKRLPKNQLGSHRTLCSPVRAKFRGRKKELDLYYYLNSLCHWAGSQPKLTGAKPCWNSAGRAPRGLVFTYQDLGQKQACVDERIEKWGKRRRIPLFIACCTIYYIHCYNHLSTHYLGIYTVSDYKTNVRSWRGASAFAALAEGLSSGPNIHGEQLTTPCNSRTRELCTLGLCGDMDSHNHN